jgi:hypothetical protein
MRPPERPERPVLVEPIPPRPPAPPFTVKLGQAMHLNGTVPRGVDLREAVPKRCAQCGALFIFIGKGSARVRFCPDCRALACPTCRRPGGGHYVYCSLGKPRPCRGCGVELGRGDGATRRQFCESCWERECPECGVRGGRHQRTCLYEQRQRRPALTEHHGLVTEAEILAVYLAHRDVAIRRAGRICGPAAAEDVVQEATVYLLEKRDYLRRFDAGYFHQAVKNAARRQRLYAWARLVVGMDPGDLVLAEQAMYPGRARSAETSSVRVRLPETV